MPKLLDFGVSKFLEDDQNHALTIAGTVLGSPLYMSPEQARGESHLDDRTDVFAFGAILFEALCGYRAYEAKNFNALIVKIATTKPKSIDECAPHVPDSLRAIVRGCLEVDLKKRLQTFEDDHLAGAQDAARARGVGAAASHAPHRDVGRRSRRDERAARCCAPAIARRPLRTTRPVTASLPRPCRHSRAAAPAACPPGTPLSHVRQRASPRPRVDPALPRVGPDRALVAHAQHVVRVDHRVGASSAQQRVDRRRSGRARRGRARSRRRPRLEGPRRRQRRFERCPREDRRDGEERQRAAARSRPLPTATTNEPPSISVDSLPGTTGGVANKPLGPVPHGSGRLLVTATPGWCNLTVDGKERGPTPVAGIDLPSGAHQLRCDAPGGKVKTTCVTIQEGATSRIKLALDE